MHETITSAKRKASVLMTASSTKNPSKCLKIVELKTLMDKKLSPQDSVKKILAAKLEERSADSNKIAKTDSAKSKNKENQNKKPETQIQLIKIDKQPLHTIQPPIMAQVQEILVPTKHLKSTSTEVETKEKLTKSQKKKEKKQKQLEKKKECSDKNSETSQEDATKSEVEKLVKVENERSDVSMETDLEDANKKPVTVKTKKQKSDKESNNVAKKSAKVKKSKICAEAVIKETNNRIIKKTKNGLINRENEKIQNTIIAQKADKSQKQIGNKNELISEVVEKTQNGIARKESEISDMIEDSQEYELSVRKFNSESNSSGSCDIDLNIDFEDNENIPAFFKAMHHKSIKKGDLKAAVKKKKTITEMPKVKKENKVIPAAVPNKLEAEKKLYKSLVQQLNTPKLCISKACDATMKNELEVVLWCFSRAIELEPKNVTHYVNRSFYYLRLNLHKQALEDANFVIKYSRNIPLLALAKFRIGQVYNSLRKYELAEKYYEESLNLHVEDKTVITELLHLKIKALVNMGFLEKDVLETLYDAISIVEACDKLITKGSNAGNQPTDSNFIDEDEVYYSDDDEEEISNVTLLNNLVNYHYQKRYASIVSKPPEKIFVNNPTKSVYVTSEKTVPYNTNNLNIIPKKNERVVKKQINYRDYENRTLWIGSLTPNITNSMIKKKFNRFGKVCSVLKPTNQAWAFINFESPINLQTALEEYQNCVIDGVKVLVKLKPKK